MFEFAEEPLDEISLAIEDAIDGTLDLAVALGRDVGLAAALVHQVDQMLPVVAAIGDDHGGTGQSLKQRGRRSLVGGLALSEGDPDRQALFIHNHVDLAAQSSTRTADGVIRTPFFPPAACWWARTMELSINCIDCGDDAARASKTRSHTPALAHRL